MTPSRRLGRGSSNADLPTLESSPARQGRRPGPCGTILRTAEQRPRDRYGLETIVCWPRPWLLLPGTARTELSAARHEVDIRAEVWLWAILWSCWAVYAWWAPLVGITVAILTYRSLCDSAALSGDLVVAAYDVYRTELYRALSWPLPVTPSEEFAAGDGLSRYLVRGIVPSAATFDRANAAASS
jgi:hypothetical protein